MLLFTPPKDAVTLICCPTGAVAEIVPVVVPLVSVRFVVSELIQVTDVVMSCCPLVLAKVARALNVTVLFCAGLRGFALKTI